MNKGYLGTLIRGFCLNLCGRPQIVVYEDPGETVNLNSIMDSDGVMKLEIGPDVNEDNAGDLIRKAYDAWKKPVTASGIILPSCAALRANGKTEALYWIDGDIDSARKRLLEKYTAPRIENAVKTGDTVKPEERASVVKNRIALVTGGAQGIGEEIVRNLASSGCLVFIADLNLDGAKKLAERINETEGRTAALALQVNVCDEKSVKSMFRELAETTGGLDLCVSNAGVLKAGSVLEQALQDFRFVTDINYTGFFVISKYAGRLLRTQHKTAPFWKTDIVQINSKSGLEGSNKNGAYAGGKFGGLGLVASFALELVDYNIKVNAICPGNFLDGPLWSHPETGLFVQYLKTGKVPGAKTLADVRLFYEAKVPMKRGCTGKDLARALLYIVEQEY